MNEHVQFEHAILIFFCNNTRDFEK
jgi:hypothetical protein